jgi:hypothetical protein
MPLTSPDIGSSPSLLADWVELQALVSSNRKAQRSVLDSIFRLTSEERSVRLKQDEETGTRDDGEIIESELEEVALNVADELEWRAEKLGPAYPFKLESRGVGNPRWELLGPAEPLTREHLIYIACLLIVAFRRSLLIPEDDIAEIFTHDYLGRIFQICACLAVGGYISGDVVSFGWPRATGDAFLPALRNAWDRFGAYTIVDAVPDGAPNNLKDGGLDVIGWRNFSDGRPARLIVFGQAASGDNWDGKSAREPSMTLIGSWFAGFRPAAWIPATIMPFLAHEDIDIVSSQDSESTISGRMQYHEQAHGIIFDRIRVASSAHHALTSPSVDSARIDGAERVGEIAAWIDRVLTTVRRVEH